MHEIIAFHERIAARRAQAAKRVPPFTLGRIVAVRFFVAQKGPEKREELRPSRPIARREAARLHPVAERTSVVEKWARRARKFGKVRLFRLWKVFGKAYDVSPPPPELARPLAERLAYLRRARRL